MIIISHINITNILPQNLFLLPNASSRQSDLCLFLFIKSNTINHTCVSKSQKSCGFIDLQKIPFSCTIYLGGNTI